MDTSSNTLLTAEDIEARIQSHPFPREGYQPTRYDRATGTYVDDGDYVEPFTETMEDGEFSWDDFVELLDDYWVKDGEEKPFVDIPEVGRIFLEKQFGGEGQGDQYWFVIRVENDASPTRYFKQNGWYASFDGGYYDGDFEEVKLVEKTVTFYE